MIAGVPYKEAEIEYYRKHPVNHTPKLNFPLED